MSPYNKLRVAIAAISWMLLLAFVALSGCAPQPRYVTSPLSLPSRPLLPVVHESELICLSDDSYRRLVERERLRREYAERLEAIIQSTHAEDN